MTIQIDWKSVISSYFRAIFIVTITQVDMSILIGVVGSNIIIKSIIHQLTESIKLSAIESEFSFLEHGMYS